MRTQRTLPKNLLGLSEDDFRRFERACDSTLNAIAPDLKGSHSRSAIVEVVLDADYLERYGEFSRSLNKTSPWAIFYRTTLAPWIEKHYHEPAFKKLMAFVFPFGRYDL